MKNISLLILVVLLTLTLQAQKNYHGLFIGANSTGYNNQSNFKSPKIGFNGGYNFYFPVGKKVTLKTGLEYSFIKSAFTRSYYCSGFCLAIPTPLDEKINLSRFSIPLGIKYNFIDDEKKRLYFVSGIETILSNKIKRIAEYSLPGTLISGTFEGKQTINFNTDSKIGFSYFGGFGTEIPLKNKNLNIEILFNNDISKNRFNTLKNIEDDGNFNTKAIGLVLKLGYTFEIDLARLKK
jgi:Outer membrane protein beta-barrel domain